MKRLKKRSRLLRVFFLVLCFAVAFSVTTMAASEKCDTVVFYDYDGSILYELTDDDSLYFYSIAFGKDEIRINKNLASDSSIVEAFPAIEIEYDYFSDQKRGTHFSAGDQIIVNDKTDGLFELRPYRLDIDYSFVGATVSTIFESVGTFAEFVSKNALLLLFAVVLPVISFGTGFLIRVKRGV